MNVSELLWCEKYRPKTIDECILPDRLKKPFQEYVDQGEVPNLLISGSAGVGKTTVAKAICEQIGCDYMVINGSDENGVDTVRFKIKNYASSLSLSGGRKVIIVDEADYLSPNAQAAFRNAIEEFSKNCSFIFTCNYKNRIMEPLHSRCAVVDFNLWNNEKSKIAGLFFKRIQTILKQENVEFEDKVVAEIVKKHFPDFRRTINELQRYSKFGKIDVGILAQVSNLNFDTLIKHMKNNDFTSVRKWVGENDVDNNTIFRKVYDSLSDTMKDENSIAEAIHTLGTYQYRQAFVADSEINLMAFLTEIMGRCQFK